MSGYQITESAAQLLTAARDTTGIGIMDDETYRKITLRHFGAGAPPAAQPISGEEIRALGIVTRRAMVNAAAAAWGEAELSSTSAILKDIFVAVDWSLIADATLIPS